MCGKGGLKLTEVEWLNIFSDELVARMKSENMTQRKLANATGLSGSIINDYVHKRKVPGYRAIINLAHALDCSIDDLVEFGDTIQ